MTLFNVGFDTVYKMPLEKFNAILNWRIKYEENKSKQMEAEMAKNKPKEPVK